LMLIGRIGRLYLFKISTRPPWSERRSPPPPSICQAYWSGTELFLAMNAAKFCHQVYPGRGSPALAGPDSRTDVPNSAL